MTMPQLERELFLFFNFLLVQRGVGQLAQVLPIDKFLGFINLDQRFKNKIAIENPGKRIDLV